MTNEKMLLILNGIKDECAKNDAFPGQVSTILLGAVAELQEDIRHECQKKKGRGNAKRDTLLKKLLKNNLPGRAETWGSHYTPTGSLYGFTDGFRAYALNDPYGYAPIEGKPFNLESIKPKHNAVKVPVDVADVEFFIKTRKAEQGRAWNPQKTPYILHHDGLEIGFNPVYLLEFCQMFKTDFLMCDKPITPAVYDDPNSGEWGVLLPVRIRHDL